MAGTIMGEGGVWSLEEIGFEEFSPNIFIQVKEGYNKYQKWFKERKAIKL